MARKHGKDRGIEERPKGSKIWFARYYDEHGKEHRELVGPKSKARQLYEQRKTEIRERRFRPDLGKREILIDDLIAQVLDVRRHLPSFRNVKRYATVLNRFFGKTQARSITAHDAKRYRAKRQDDGVGDQTIYHELSLLRSACNLGVELGSLDRCVIRKLKQPANGRIRYLSDEEEVALLSKLESHWRPHVLFAIHTGLRWGEQFRMKRRYVDKRAKVVEIPKAKGGKRRVVELNQTALAALDALPRYLRSDLQFPSPEGRPMHHSNFSRRVFNPAVKAAGLGDFRWHDLRHTFASRLVMGGVDLRTVADLLGHSSLQMVMRYSHLAPGARGRAVAVLDRPTGTPTGHLAVKGDTEGA